MVVNAEQIVEKFQPLVNLVSGDPKASAAKPCAQEAPVAGGITFVSDKKIFLGLLQSPVNIIVADARICADESLTKSAVASGKTILQSKNVYLAMALINQTFFAVAYYRKPFQKENIHPTAVIHPDAKLAAGVIVGPGVVINAGVQIGARTSIGANSVIEQNVIIGEDCFIHALVAIAHTVRIGNKVEIKSHAVIGSDGFGYAHDEKGNHYRLPHYGELIIEDDVHIGASVNIDRGTFEPAIIRYGVKIDNHCHLGHNTQIGKNTLITAGFISAGSVKVGANNVFGGRCSINGRVETCDNVTFAGLSGIANDIKEPGIYGGFPTIDYKTSLKAQASIGSLPRLRRNVAKIMKQLGLKEDGE